MTLRQLLNVEYAAELEAVSVDDVERIKWERELTAPPPGRKRRGRPVTFISPDLERFMEQAG